MPYTLRQFRRDFVLEHLDELKPEERLKGLKPDEILSKLDPGTIRSYLSRQGRRSRSGVRPRGRVRRKTGSR